MANNELPDREDRRFYKGLPKDFGRPDMVFGGVARIVDFGPLIKGDWYFKDGRSTDIITLICYGTEAYKYMADTRSKYDGNWVRGNYEECGYTAEYIIVSAGLDVETAGAVETESTEPAPGKRLPAPNAVEENERAEPRGQFCCH